MSAIVFPYLPAVGDIWPPDPGTGNVTQYIWDGEKWNTIPTFVSLGSENQGAHNTYQWPEQTGVNNQYLRIDGSDNLRWETPVTSLTSDNTYIRVTPNVGDVHIDFIDNSASFFNPFVSVGGGSYSGRVGTGDLGTFYFTAPDGCNFCAIWSRCRFTIYSNVTTDTPNCVAWASNVQYQLFGTGGLNLLNPNAGLAPAMSVACRATRGSGLAFPRFNTASISGSGNRTVGINVQAIVEQGSGSSDWYLNIDAPQLIVLPYQL